MDISVVMPCHNSEKWVKRALNSVAQQTLKAKEVIVINDSSTDNSLSAIQQTNIATKIITVSAHNAAYARNIGIQNVQNNWIAFLDSDDEWLPDHLLRASNLIGSSDIAYLSTCYLRYSEDSSDIFQFKWPSPWPESPATGLNKWDFIEWFSLATAFSHSSLIVSTESIRSISGYDENLPRRHDYELFLRLINTGSWTFDPFSTTIFQKDSPKSISRNSIECDYYFLLGLQKNYVDYCSPHMDFIIKHQTKNAVRNIILKNNFQHAIQILNIAKHHLTLHEFFIIKTLFKLRLISPVIYKCKDFIFKRIKKFSTNGDSSQKLENMLSYSDYPDD